MPLFIQSRASVLRALAFAVVCAPIITTRAVAQSPRVDSDSLPKSPSGMTYFFYTGKDYGSDAAFNPLSEVFNEGFDVLGLLDQNRHIFNRGVEADFHNVWRSVWHFDATYRNYGWKVVKNEFLPITSTRVPGGGSWLPNYEAHLMGSGMVSRKMTEWYEMHGYPHPVVLACLTMYAAHFSNETVENEGFRRLNEDATTDLLFFDLGGMLLWQSGYMQRAFSGSFRLMNWPLQPSWNPTSRTLENSGQNFVLRGPIPRTDAWRWFYLFGLSGSGGLTRVFHGGNALSVGFGLDAIANPVVDTLLGAKGATLRPKGAIYYDRNGSLLWSVAVGTPNGVRSRISANLYPDVLKIGPISPGLWLQIPRAPRPGDREAIDDGKFRVGIVSSWGLGAAAGAKR
jgi:hypothetical protein